MSAECGTCGADIVYPAGTWPIGICPECDKDKRITNLRAALCEIAETQDSGRDFAELARGALEADDRHSESWPRGYL